MSKDYFDDRTLLQGGDLVDEHLHFTSAATNAGVGPEIADAAEVVA